MTTRYVTSAIPYVNAEPHLGFALEIVNADVLARHTRLRGGSVRFLTGTDDNALKNVTAAAAVGLEVKDFVGANAQRFEELRTPLGLSYDDFIRTSSDPRHAPGVRKLWDRCVASGDFCQKEYRGLYCGGCEQFYSDPELVNGRCPEHGTIPEVVEESNWFFRLSRYQDRILELIESGAVLIDPVQRQNEVLAFLRAGLEDISVSRPALRSGGWGIPVPRDESQVVYVWWDALANYLTALGYGTDDQAYQDWWINSDERIHVIGKGVIRFHAVYWLAQLLSAGEPLPTAIVVHDYLTLNGTKISKSAHNTVDPSLLSARFGSDSVRWWLLRDVAKVGETDFTEARLVDRVNADLADGPGNLVNRSLSIVQKYCGGVISGAPAGPFATAAAELPAAIDKALDEYDFRAATAAVCAVVEAGNRRIESVRPWELYRAEQSGDGAAAAQLTALLAELVAGCRVLAREIAPFVPALADRLRAQLGEGNRIETPQPAFPRLEAP